MPNEWIHNVLGTEHQIILFMTFNADLAVKTDGKEAAFKIGIHPGLRHVGQKTLDMILDGLEEGVETLRKTPLDDLHLILKDQV